MKNQKGFSLIELLIVVVIIGIIAAIAIPNLLAARRSANEGSAIASLRTLHSGQMNYQSTVGGGNYGTMAQLNTAGIIDSSLSSTTKSGYSFAENQAPASPSAPASFAFTATAQTTTGVTRTGERAFAVATDGVLLFSAPTAVGTSAAACTIVAGPPVTILATSCTGVMGN